MTGPTFRPAEVIGALTALRSIDDQDEIPDPFGWHDLVHAHDETVGVVGRRLAAGGGPRRVHLFPWPKESGGHRLFSIVDPFDRIVYHAAAGRVAGPIAGGLDAAVVSFELLVRGPGFGWSLVSGKTLHRRRVALAKAHLVDAPGRTLVTADVQNHFGSTTIASIDRALDMLWVDRRASEAAFAWLAAYQTIHDGSGVPLGHDGSRLLAHAALLPADEALRSAGIVFVRWVDDFWLIIEPGLDVAGALSVLSDALASSGYALNESKTNSYTAEAAVDVIENAAIASTIERERSGGDEAALELFEHAVGAPAAYATELRWSLGSLSRKLNPAAASQLFEHPEAIDVAHAQTVKYLRNLAGAKKTRSYVDLDALIDLATDPVTVRDRPYRSLAATKVLATLGIGADRAARLRELATGPMNVQPPLRTWAVRAAHNGKPFSGRMAVDGVLASAGVDVKRAFALTLADRVEDCELKKWCDRIVADETDLSPTVAWLRDGAPVP